jgi:N-hydroxyarylamine O-acetyltransferase
LISIPFENLDIHMGRRIRLSEDAFYEKIIKHHRGGFCYELNGSFASLLRRLGFKVRMLSARVASKTGGFSPEFDHMTLLVTMKDCWLADVGFGDSFTEPKLLDYLGPQTDSGRIYQITRKMGGRLLSRWDAEKKIWEPQYQFTLQARNLADYARRCRWHETSPNSHFRKGRMCTQLTPNGRVTLTDRKLIVTRGSKRTESSVKTRTEFNRLLQKQFGMNPG